MRHALILAICAISLSACSDPLKDVPRLADVEASADAGQSAALDGAAVTPEGSATEPKGGFLGFLRGRAEDRMNDAGTETSAPAEPKAAAGEPAEPQSGGLFGFLRGSDANSEDEPDEAPVTLAAKPPETTSDAEPERQGIFGGLFGGGAKATAVDPDAPDYQQVGPGARLPFGEVARLCGVSANRLGQKVDEYPKRGRGYDLIDSQKGGTGLRNFYLSGFNDGCARQFTAALVIFGDAETYEQIRFGPSGENQPVSETDAAYDRLKSSICRVGRNKPCGAKVSRLMKDTVFVSIYERFGSNPRWKTLLLHDGEVAAVDLKSSN